VPKFVTAIEHMAAEKDNGGEPRALAANHAVTIARSASPLHTISEDRTLPAVPGRGMP